MIVTETLPSDLSFMPYVGNGYLAANVALDSLFVGGLFNGKSTSGPSHRARVPFQLSLTLSGAHSSSTASALDIQHAAFLQHATLSTGATADLRFFAPRHRPHVVVVDLVINGTAATEPTVLQLKTNNGTASKDVAFVSAGSPPAGVFSLLGKTLVPEDPEGGSVQGVAVAFSAIPETLSCAARATLELRFVMAVHTSLDTEWEALVDSAIASHSSAMTDRTLFSAHCDAWAQIWESGIDVGGNVDLAAKVNASMYFILSSLRSDWAYGLSPGSLCSNSYNGHSFWDTETWMQPTLALLYPPLAKSLLEYRIVRINGAVRKAKSYSPPYNGAMYPWESALTGIETCPTWAATGLREIHINGDISLAAWQYFNQTRDLSWLAHALPMLEGIADFWVSKATFNNATGEYWIDDVIPPDEYVDHVKNSVYTNAVARISLQVASMALKLLGHAVPSAFSEVASKIRIPFDSVLGIHPEFDGYSGGKIKQADVVLLGFPLMLPMDKAIRRADLEYYAARTDSGGPSMTWGMHAIGMLELGDVENATVDFAKSQLNMQPPFNVWSETTTGGAVNFITGAGGFLQGLWAGFGGIRVQDGGFAATPRLPPGSKSLGVRGISVLGAAIDFLHNGASTSVVERTAGTAALCLLADAVSRELKPGQPVVLSSPSFLVRVC